MSTARRFEKRGIRDNNPGNIEAVEGMKWHGQLSVDPGGYIIFKDATWGIRAGVIIWQNYKYYHGFTHLAQYIERWAPPKDNLTGDYIQFVCQQTGLTAYGPFDPCLHTLPLVKAIITYENGIQPYSDITLNEGIALAHIR